MNDEGHVLMVYMTAASQDEADRIAERLVEQQAAACVNILGPMRSVYRWNDAIERSEEVALVAKTTDLALPRLEHLVKEMHSYECPCIVALPVEAGHMPFLDWVRKSVREQ